MEQHLNEKKETFAETSFEELDALWDESEIKLESLYGDRKRNSGLFSCSY